MKILITGGTTFVSRYTAEHFVKKGDDVYVLNRNTRTQPGGVHLIEGDRNNLGGKLSGIHFDVILDITAYTAKDVESLLDSGVTFDDYIMVSSSAVYPETNVQPFSEEQSCGENSYWGAYGTNKIAAEQVLSERLPNAYILRPPYLYGIYDNLYREAFVFDCAVKDRPFFMPGDGSLKLQFFNVSDLCRFMEILLEKHPENKIFNVGSEPVTVRKWVAICYKAAGKVPELISVGSEVETYRYFCFRNYEYELDISKQRALMPDTVPLEDGIREEYEWYRENTDSIYSRKEYMRFIDESLR